MFSHRRHSRLSCPAWIAGALTICLAGCSVFDRTPAESSQGSAFSWLANWVSQPIDVAPGFDVESLRPDARPAHVAPGDLLEITVWDLYEPGQPYTFPVRVSDKRTIEVPFLSEFSVADRTIPDVESGLVHGYRAGEFLVNPRILVRPLDPPTVKVQASGAVLRPGYVELSRTDTSVYAALMSAGGARKNAGSQIGVVRRSARVTRENASPDVAASDTARIAAPVSGLMNAPEHQANSLEERSVSAMTKQSDPAPASEALPQSDGDRQTDSSPQWYNLGRAEDREALRSVQLAEGDEVIVKAALSPVRVGGSVRHPGAYPLPPGRNLNVWQAIETAGGVASVDTPLNITLIRPASEGRAARRWFLNVDSYEKHPPTSPLVEAGDVLHIEPTTGSKIKRAVGDLWNKP